MMTRRAFGGSLAAFLAGCRGLDFASGPWFKTRGVVVYNYDLDGQFNWPKFAHECGITTIATHFGPDTIVPFMKSDAGKRFFDECLKCNIAVEHELHSWHCLMPKGKYFAKHPEYFRENEKNERVCDGNFCPSSEKGLEIAVANALEIARVCKSTTGRHYFWRDDGPAMACNCWKCRELTVTDQALIVENAILKALRAEINPNATISHLAYGPTIPPPTFVRPDAGVFLEYAPFQYRVATRPKFPALRPGHWNQLDALLKFFPAETAQALEYWLDESAVCKYKREAPVSLEWHEDTVKQDLEQYAKRGIRHITTFAAWVNDTYVKHGCDLEPIRAYGRVLRSW